MVGPITVQAKPNPLPLDLVDFINSAGENGFIIASFGSYAQTIISKAKIDVLGMAFGKLKQNVIWKLTGNSYVLTLIFTLCQLFGLIKAGVSQKCSHLMLFFHRPRKHSLSRTVECPNLSVKCGLTDVRKYGESNLLLKFRHHLCKRSIKLCFCLCTCKAHLNILYKTCHNYIN